MADLKKRLAGLKTEFKAAKERDPSSGFDRCPDGMYRLQLVSAEVGESQASGRLQAAFEWSVLGGEFDGKSVFDYQGLETEDNLFYFGRLLAKLGREMPDDPTEIPAVLDALVEAQPVVQGQLRTKDDYQNLRVKKLLEGEDTAADTEAAEEVAEEVANDTATYDIGDEVNFKNGKVEMTGTILKWDGDDKAIIDASGKKYKINRSLIIGRVEAAAEEVVEEAAEEAAEEVVEEAAPAEEEGVEIGEGDSVTFKVKGKPVIGTIASFPDDEHAIVEVNGKMLKVKLADCDPAPAAEETEEVAQESGDEPEEQTPTPPKGGKTKPPAAKQATPAKPPAATKPTATKKR